LFNYLILFFSFLAVGQHADSIWTCFCCCIIIVNWCLRYGIDNSKRIGYCTFEWGKLFVLFNCLTLLNFKMRTVLLYNCVVLCNIFNRWVLYIFYRNSELENKIISLFCRQSNSYANKHVVHKKLHHWQQMNCVNCKHVKWQWNVRWLSKIVNYKIWKLFLRCVC
jgi:hypothetical protein